MGRLPHTNSAAQECTPSCPSAVPGAETPDAHTSRTETPRIPALRAIHGPAATLVDGSTAWTASAASATSRSVTEVCRDAISLGSTTSPGLQCPLLHIWPVPRHSRLESSEGLREVAMTTSPNVNHLAVRDTETLGDLGSTHQLIYVDATKHTRDACTEGTRGIRSGGRAFVPRSRQNRYMETLSQQGSRHTATLLITSVATLTANPGRCHLHRDASKPAAHVPEGREVASLRTQISRDRRSFPLLATNPKPGRFRRRSHGYLPARRSPRPSSPVPPHGPPHGRGGPAGHGYSRMRGRSSAYGMFRDDVND